MDWVFNQVKDHEQFGKAVDRAVDQLLRRFLRIHFVRKALDGIPGGSALIDLQSILELLPVEYEADIIAKIKGLWEQLSGSPKDIKLAMQELGKAAPGRDARYVVMEHTHKALQAPVKQVCLGGGPPQVYLNTGNWRLMVYPCHQEGFVTWKEICYAVVYAPGEIMPAEPTFETWSGRLYG